jgi:xylan 1,4-beta-xylosidase
VIGLYGLRKPSYWAYYLLHQMGTQRLLLKGDGDGFGGLITGWATRDKDGSIRMILSNVTEEQSQARGSDVLTRHVLMSICHLPINKQFRIRHFRIDNAHTNVYAVWEAMGSPRWPTSQQLIELQKSDGLASLSEDRKVTSGISGQVLLDFNMPMPAVSFVLIEAEHSGVRDINERGGARRLLARPRRPVRLGKLAEDWSQIPSSCYTPRVQ